MPRGQNGRGRPKATKLKHRQLGQVRTATRPSVEAKEGMCTQIHSQLPQTESHTLVTSCHIHKEVLGLNLKTPNKTFQVGGKISLCLANWLSITKDTRILNTVKGYQLDFVSTPAQSLNCGSLHYSPSERLAMNAEIMKMLEKGAIEEIHENSAWFLSNIFLRPKKDGSLRPVFNLKILNGFIRYEHFKMEGIATAINLIQEGDWMGKIDLKDAYFGVSIAEKDRKFLQFRWANKLFQFKALPFGLASAPRAFTKLLKPIVALLRRLGVRVVIYLDDMLFLNQRKELLVVDMNTALWLLEHLGFLINWEKSNLSPTQKLEFLGMLLDSVQMTVSLPEKKTQSIQSDCRDMLRKGVTSVRNLAKLIGKLTSSVLAVSPAPLNYRRLQMQKSRALLQSKQNYAANITLPDECRQELAWWIENLQNWNGKAMISPAPDMVITTDSSLKGWGATCEGVTTQGLWKSSESKKHINALELTAAFFAIQAFTKGKKVKHVHLRVDNSATVAQINKMGGTRSPKLMTITRDLWNYCLSRQITATASHLPGSLNWEADQASRVYTDSSNWKLERSVFQRINQTWGPVIMDLFADRTNAQIPTYMSWKPDPYSQGTDAFSINWRQGLHYAFPPFCLINKCLWKAQREMADLILITPTWQTQTWFPAALDMSVEEPILLTSQKELLTSPGGEPHPLMEKGDLKLAAWRISGNRLKREAFRNGLQRFTCKPKGQEPNPLTIAPGVNGLAGVLEGKSILFRPL